MYLLLIILILYLYIFVHELGHIHAAKTIGLKVNALELYSPPYLRLRRISPERYAIYLGVLPIGAGIVINRVELDKFSARDKVQMYLGGFVYETRGMLILYMLVLFFKPNLWIFVVPIIIITSPLLNFKLAEKCFAFYAYTGGMIKYTLLILFLVVVMSLTTADFELQLVHHLICITLLLQSISAMNWSKYFPNSDGSKIMECKSESLD